MAPDKLLLGDSVERKKHCSAPNMSIIWQVNFSPSAFFIRQIGRIIIACYYKTNQHIHVTSTEISVTIHSPSCWHAFSCAPEWCVLKAMMPRHTRCHVLQGESSLSNPYLVGAGDKCSLQGSLTSVDILNMKFRICSSYHYRWSWKAS